MTRSETTIAPSKSESEGSGAWCLGVPDKIQVTLLNHNFRETTNWFCSVIIPMHWLECII